MNEFNLFRKCLGDFHLSSKELPINLLNPILVKLEFLLGELHYENNDISERVNLLVAHLEKRSKERPFDKVFYMYSIVLLVDEIFKYHLDCIDMIVQASKETLDIDDHKNKDEYWLTAWHPSKVIDKEKYKHGIMEAEKNWKKCTKELRIALFDRTFMPPLGEDIDSWGILRGRHSSSPPEE